MTLYGFDNLRLAKNDRLAELDQRKTSNSVVGAMSSIPTRATLYFASMKLFKTSRFTEMRVVLKTKTNQLFIFELLGWTFSCDLKGV